MAGKPLTKGTALYNRLVSILTELNASLGEKQQLTLAQRRDMVSDILYPQFQEVPTRDLRIYLMQEAAGKALRKQLRAQEKKRKEREAKRAEKKRLAELAEKKAAREAKKKAAEKAAKKAERKQPAKAAPKKAVKKAVKKPAKKAAPAKPTKKAAKKTAKARVTKAAKKLTKKGKKAGVTGTGLYRLIFHEITVYNASLDPSFQISQRRRYQMASEMIYPVFKDLPKRDVTIPDIQMLIAIAFGETEQDQSCNPNYLDPSIYEVCEWYSIDPQILRLPACINIRVYAGTNYGITEIVNTANYDYHRDGVSDIVERIREDAESKSGYAHFEGVIKTVDPKKADWPQERLRPEDYFIDYVLVVEDEPLGDRKPYRFIRKRKGEFAKAAKQVREKMIQKSKAVKVRKSKFTYNMRQYKREKDAIDNQIAKIARLKNKDRRKTEIANFEQMKQKLIDRLDSAYNQNLFDSDEKFNRLYYQIANLKVPKK